MAPGAKPKAKPKKFNPRGPAFACPFAGTDRGSIDPKRGVQWYLELFKNSDYTFTGCYLTEPIEPADRDNFTSASGVANHWTPLYNDVRKLPDPWGFAFWHMGYSEIAGGPMRDKNGKPIIDKKTGKEMDEHFYVMPHIPWTQKTGHDLGIMGAQRLKRIVQNLGPETTGAVVFLDIEPSIKIRDEIWTYYKEFFKELNTYRDGEPMPVRAGSYAPLTTAGRLLEWFPDLFIWTVDSRVFRGNTWDQSSSTMKFKFQEFPINAIQYVPQGKKEAAIYIPLGRQGLINFNTKMPNPDLQTLKGIDGWDFNQSFVRDPRFPEAGDPRFVTNGTILLVGSFDRKSGSMLVSQKLEKKAIKITGVNVEPESPMILTQQKQLFLLAVTGQIVTANQTAEDTWSPLAVIMLPAPTTAPLPLRRIRAMTVVARSATDTQLFYVVSDLTLQARRLKDKDPWTDPERMCAKVLVHPYSKLASIASPRGIVDIFFMNSDGILINASTFSQPPPEVKKPIPFPGNTFQPLDASPPTLLPGTHLATAKPSDRQIAVFAISASLRLTVAAWTDGKGWGSLQLLGSETDTLFAHSHLAALPTSDKVVLVAAIAQNGVPVVYTVTLTGNAAVATRVPYPRKAEPLPESAAGVLPPNPAGAVYLDVNPWGDVGLAKVEPPPAKPGAGAAPSGPNVVLSVTGSFPGQGAILQRRINGMAPDWAMVVT